MSRRFGYYFQHWKNDEVKWEKTYPMNFTYFKCKTIRISTWCECEKKVAQKNNWPFDITVTEIIQRQITKTSISFETDGFISVVKKKYLPRPSLGGAGRILKISPKKNKWQVIDVWPNIVTTRSSSWRRHSHYLLSEKCSIKKMGLDKTLMIIKKGLTIFWYGKTNDNLHNIVL